jgi:hypothetical protein
MALPKISGKKLQAAAIELAHQRGYIVAHFTAVTDSRGFSRTPVGADGKGFPDLLLVGKKVVAIEVKGTGDSLRPEQKVWLQAFEDAGVETLVLTVRAYVDGALEALL